MSSTIIPHLKFILRKLLLYRKTSVYYYFIKKETSAFSLKKALHQFDELR